MADKQDNFFGGFILGTIVGSLIGVVVASKLNSSESQTEAEIERTEADNGQIRPQNNVDQARLSLEQKIAQLNAAIDAVSHELSNSGNVANFPIPKSNLNGDTDEEISLNPYKK